MKFKLFLVIMSLLAFLCPYNVYASSSIEIGDYIKMGEYNSEPLYWRYVGNDSNGKLMVSDKIMCYKAYDAKGTHSPDTKKRTSYGSNLWSMSNIRCWLNSDSVKVDYLCGNAPSTENVWNGYGSYNSEAGFLTNFNDSEKASIKSVVLRTTINDNDTPDGTYPGYIINEGFIPAIEEQNFQYSTDKMFLLDIEQLFMIKSNFNDLYYVNSRNSDVYGDYSEIDTTMKNEYFLRSPNTYIKAADGVYTVGCSTDGEPYYNPTVSAYMASGIRPAFYLEDNVSFIKGNGEYNSPYVISGSPHTIITTKSTEEKILTVRKDNNNLKLYAEGKEIKFTDAQPFIDGNSRTQIPIRAISESLGYNVDYDEDSRTVMVSDNNTVIKLTIGSVEMLCNNESIIMDTTAEIINERTYIPLRFVCEALGYTVNFEENVIGWQLNEVGDIIIQTDDSAVDR